MSVKNPLELSTMEMEIGGSEKKTEATQKLTIVRFVELNLKTSNHLAKRKPNEDLKIILSEVIT